MGQNHQHRKRPGHDGAETIEEVGRRHRHDPTRIADVVWEALEALWLGRDLTRICSRIRIPTRHRTRRADTRATASGAVPLVVAAVRLHRVVATAAEILEAV